MAGRDKKKSSVLGFCTQISPLLPFLWMDCSSNKTSRYPGAATYSHLPMLEHQHCQNPNYDTPSPAGCIALQLTQPHSTGACGVTSCSQINNTLRLCETSHLILFIPRLLPGMCERPRASPSPSLLPMPLLFILIDFHNRLQILLVLGKRREKKSQLCFASIHCH